MKAKSIAYVRFSPHEHDPERMGQLVEAYREVFAATPWHEWLKCAKCDKYWGKKDLPSLTSIGFKHHRKPLVDFWTRDGVVKDLKHEITPASSCWLALLGTTVVGFTWGYPLNLKKLEKKLKLPVSARFHELFGSGESIAYQDELGVLDEFRGQKIAKTLVAKRHDDFIKRGLKIGVVRTRQSPEPSMTYLWYTGKLGYETLATYTDGRVVLARQLKGLKELLHA